MPKHSPRLFGFTLLELLVVISIIGILVAMGAASFSVAQQQGRNARRSSDMKSAQNAMEQDYVANSNVYACSASGFTLTAGGQTFTSPKTGDYSCSVVSSGTPTVYTYCACALLDGTGKGNHNGVSTTCDAATENLNGTGNYFCVKSLQ
jgi:prepilin-type N-terminal cleavage/methylation domain-containing protein